jgi:hypothetical protein
MNILNSILEKIIPRSHAASSGSGRPSPLQPQESNVNAQANGVDVEEVMRGMEARSGQKLDWRHSIVDLMKMLGMDSSLTARRQLAKELNYTGDTSDSAKMNVWLHEQVLKKLEENGGKIPDSMKH